MTSRSAAGGKRTSRSTSPCTALAASWKSSRTSTTGSSRAPSASTRAGSTSAASSVSRGLAASLRRRASSVARATASSAALQKRRLSAVPSPSVIHATGPGARPSATHEARSALLPEPAGAASSVSDSSMPASTASKSR
jgi:hypothetical protein